MNPLAETFPARLEILLAHAKDTFSHQRDYVHKRDWLFIYALLAVVAISLRTTYASGSDRILEIAVTHLLGPGQVLDAAVMAVLLWFAFFAIVARYFQAVITVERQYEYLEALEVEISSAFGTDVLARESRAYLANYPLFSNWMHWIYTWVFPSGIALATFGGAIVECRRFAWSATAYVVVALSSAILATVAVFLYSTKVQGRKR